MRGVRRFEGKGVAASAATSSSPDENKKIRITEIAAASYYCPRKSWILRVLGLKEPPSAVTIRGSTLHGFYEIMDRDMAVLVKEHGVISTPEIVMVLRDHLVTAGLSEVIPRLIEDDGADPMTAKMFVVTLADETAYSYVPTYNHILYHGAPSKKGLRDIIVREVRREVEYKGYIVSGKPDWLQYYEKKKAFLIDYKTGAPKQPDLYQVIQAGGYTWLVKKAMDVDVLLNIIFWQGYHRFACLIPQVEFFTERLDEFIEMVQDREPPAYASCPACHWCPKTAKSVCHARRAR